MLQYEDLQPISRAELALSLSPDVPADERAQALLRMALHDPDWRWVERQCLAAIQDTRLPVKQAGIVGLGHIARIHRQISVDLVVKTLRQMEKHPELAGTVEDTLDDILIFTEAPERQ